ncbi:MAG: hypothetical protein ACRCR2_06805 [Fusobacteriaceae bacterium]
MLMIEPKEWIEIIESGEKGEERVEVSFKCGEKQIDFNSEHRPEKKDCF